MNRTDDDRSIRRIALRLLNEDEEQARKELDGLIRAVEEHVRRKSFIYTWAVPALLSVPPLFLILSLLVSSFSKPAGNLLFGVAQISCLIPLYVLWNWRRFQYGRGRLWESSDAIYADASDETIEKLEKLFSYLRREERPKTYYLYRDRKGRVGYIDRRHFFGRLRVLLLSEFGTIRALCLSPEWKRISEEIKIEAEPDDVIRELNVKPQRKGGAGTNAKYPYEDAAISLIGDPRLSALDLHDRKAALKFLSDRIIEWFKDNPHISGDIPRSDYGRVQDVAKKIFTRLQKVQGLGKR